MGVGLDLFDALFKIKGKPRLRPTKTQPQHDERKQNQRDRRYKALFGPAIR